ncbi:hypothetical protein BCR24_04440 [Enterococcus ureilyticus]|uniref:Uncharacterized protein n=1 Tax=Enterococcus ureilyticus TaxID=1131292 RepID=A0A1E5HAI1_9ENTE|nr:polysaccharide biosynthesis C-terminal domain-containing protein [Enterococcus ureilyticus]MBM7688895.1 O-antigen/teichoic acid export membrane protein [Enterococcus ureilyticus]MBO0445516.1 polysaccharide biosynthesis C-terminal domain-containing protein [Enterococcus ureilyticus]OEG21958.1 hypothetical protein BCR24_04440 [Enterococcus ureilyticus]
MYQGLLFNIIYNVLFVLTGYIMHYFLGSVMTPAQYGIVGTIITILDFEYLFLNNGVRQSLSKELSKKRYNIKDLLLKSLVFQLLLISVLFSINFFGAPVFANVLNDQSFSVYLKYVAFIIPINGIYVLSLGINDGLKHFVSSAWIGIFYAIAKLSVIPFVIYVFTDPVIGTVMGFLFAIFVALIVGIITIIRNRRDLIADFKAKIPFKSYIHSVFSFSLFFIIVSVVLSVDTLVVKSVVADKDMAGYYTGAVNFGKVSYFLLSAFFTIILPTTTAMYVAGNIDRMKKTVRDMMLIIVAFIMPITCIISASSGTLLSVFYSPEYKEATMTLAILAFSHFFMGVAVMTNMIISSTNEKKFSTWLALIMLVLDITACIILTNYYGIIGTAISSILCTFFTMLISALFMKKILFNLINKEIVKIIVFNLILWIVVFLIFKVISINNIFCLILIYGILYVAVLGILLSTKLLKIEKLYAILGKDKENKIV